MAQAVTMNQIGFEGLLDGLDPVRAERRRPVSPKSPSESPAERGAEAKAQPGRAPKNADDARLVAALTGGERGAWNGFVKRFAGIVFAAVQRRLIPAGRAEEVEDVVQEVFVRLVKAEHRLLKSYDPARARLSTWLTVVATSAAIDHLRRQRMAKVALDDAPAASLAVEDPAFENVKIPEGLLSARQALVLELLYRRDLEVADAARIMQIDPQTVRSTHHKALTKLRAHFREIGELAG